MGMAGIAHFTLKQHDVVAHAFHMSLSTTRYFLRVFSIPWFINNKKRKNHLVLTFRYIDCVDVTYIVNTVRGQNRRTTKQKKDAPRRGIELRSPA